MPMFYMMVGLPGSGKSFTAESIPNAVVHSSDAIRAEVLGDENDQTQQDLVFQTLHKRVLQDLADGKDVVYDATNINYKRRIGFLDRVRALHKHDLRTVCLFMATPYEVCLERNNNAPFKVSSRCCTVMKKQPMKKYSKETGRVPIIATMANESRSRRATWLRMGCNAFSGKKPSSQPMSFWTEEDVLEYLYTYQVPYASVYGEIVRTDGGGWTTTGEKRTGCVFCAFGAHLEKAPNRFQRLKITHPKLWDYCMRPWEEHGLGMRQVLEYIGVPIE